MGLIVEVVQASAVALKKGEPRLADYTSGGHFECELAMRHKSPEKEHVERTRSVGLRTSAKRTKGSNF